MHTQIPYSLRKKLGLRGPVTIPLYIGSPEYEKIFGKIRSIPSKPPPNNGKKTGEVDESEVLFRLAGGEDSDILPNLSEEVIKRAKAEQEQRELQKIFEDAQKQMELEREKKRVEEERQKRLQKSMEEQAENARLERIKNAEIIVDMVRKSSAPPSPLEVEELSGSYLIEEDDGGDINLEEIPAHQVSGLPPPQELKVVFIPEWELEDLRNKIPENRRFYVTPSQDGITILGKTYTLSEYGGEFSLSRSYNRLTIWPNNITSEAFLRRIYVSAREYDEVEWPQGFAGGRIDQKEKIKLRDIEEEKALFIHPVPESDSKNSYDLKVLEYFQFFDKITISGSEYYIVKINSINEWLNILRDFQKMRLCSLKGDKITVYEKNGSVLFKNDQTIVFSNHGKSGPPLPRESGYITPHHTEMHEIYDAYDVTGTSRVRYLFPIGDKFNSLNIDSLLNLLVIAEKQLINNAGVPLLSIGGRWYLALENEYLGSRKTTYEERRIKVHSKIPIGSIRAGPSSSRSQEMPLEQKTSNVIPEGEVRWLEEIPPQTVKLNRIYGYVVENIHISGEEPAYFIIHKSEHPNSLKVQCINGNVIVLN